MKIRMLTLAAGPDGVLQAGKIAEVPEATARALIAGGYAVDLTPCPFPNPLQGAEAAREGEEEGGDELEDARAPGAPERAVIVRRGKRK